MLNNPAELLGNPKIGKYIPPVLSPNQVDQLLSSPVPGDAFWQRDRALLEMLYATGCRVSEMANLSLHNIYLDKKYACTIYCTYTILEVEYDKRKCI